MIDPQGSNRPEKTPDDELPAEILDAVTGGLETHSITLNQIA
jgi:hypothetical protein